MSAQSQVGDGHRGTVFRNLKRVDATERNWIRGDLGLGLDMARAKGRNDILVEIELAGRRSWAYCGELFKLYIEIAPAKTNAN